MLFKDNIERITFRTITIFAKGLYLNIISKVGKDGRKKAEYWNGGIME
jgi:hypothetical protein